jgi:hypothetical protein
MEPPVNRPTYPGSAKKQGASIRKKGTHRPEVLWTLRIGEIFGFRIGQAGIAGRDLSALSSFAPAAYRLSTTRQPRVSEAAQTVSTLPENAVASASISSALRLLHPRRSPSIWSAWFVSVWGSRRVLRLDLPQRTPQSPVPKPPLSSVCDRGQAPSPEWSVARNRQGP